MIEVFGDAWELSKNNFLCITTNGQVKNNGKAVMGRGIAKQAADRFPELPELLGDRLKLDGNHVHPLGKWENWLLFSFPTKHDWRFPSQLSLIEQSINELAYFFDIPSHNANYMNPLNKKIFLPRPGCSNGGLAWEDVKPLVSKLDDRFYIVAYEEEKD